MNERINECINENMHELKVGRNAINVGMNKNSKRGVNEERKKASGCRRSEKKENNWK